jgi:hypothetical protein
VDEGRRLNSRRRTATLPAAIGDDLCSQLPARAHQITAARIVKPPKEVAI